MRKEVTIQRLEPEQRVAYAIVYAPGDLDSHREFMSKADVREMAWDFMLRGLGRMIDVDHNNQTGRAAAVETFLVRRNDPDFPDNEDAWVVGGMFFDERLWHAVKSGDKAGWSIEADVLKIPARVRMAAVNGRYVGRTYAAEGQGLPAHEHRFVAELDAGGNVRRGHTDTVLGHRHELRGNLKSERAAGHLHLFRVPRTISQARAA